MRTLASMEPKEIEEYMALIGQATAAVVPPDGTFCVIVSDADGNTNYVSNAQRRNVPKMLREMADLLDSDIAQKN